MVAPVHSMSLRVFRILTRVVFGSVGSAMACLTVRIIVMRRAALLNLSLVSKSSVITVKGLEELRPVYKVAHVSSQGKSLGILCHGLGSNQVHGEDRP